MIRKGFASFKLQLPLPDENHFETWWTRSWMGVHIGIDWMGKKIISWSWRKCNYGSLTYQQIVQSLIWLSNRSPILAQKMELGSSYSTNQIFNFVEFPSVMSISMPFSLKSILGYLQKQCVNLAFSLAGSLKLLSIIICCYLLHMDAHSLTHVHAWIWW